MIVSILHSNSINGQCRSRISVQSFVASSLAASSNFLSLTLALPLPRCVILTTPHILSPHGSLGLARELGLLDSLDECHNNASSPDNACGALQGLPSESYCVSSCVKQQI